MGERDLLDGIVDLTQRLVSVDSRVGCESFEPVIETTEEWLFRNALSWNRLWNNAGHCVGLFLTIDSGSPGPVIGLDAPLDTANAVEEEWTHEPFGAEVVDGRLYGRGAADSKVAVVIFCHLAREAARSSLVRRGRLVVVFDADEHSGRFGGIRAFVEGQQIRPDFVAIGYPGNAAVRHGARGIYRATVKCFGEEQHSGARQKRPHNAVLKAARLGLRFAESEANLPDETDPEFSPRALGPSISITRIAGGKEQGFSQIPGSAEVDVDVRLTPTFPPPDGARLIDRVTQETDAAFPGGRSSEITEVASWPGYRLERSCEHAIVLRDCARAEFGEHVDFKVCGPSNVGNYLATQNIPAICGFGVASHNEHAPDE